MKKILFYILPLLLAFTSCTTNHVHVVNHGSKHKGWYKNSHNPHHPMTTNPGHTKRKGGVVVVAPSSSKVVVVPAGKGKGKGKKKK